MADNVSQYIAMGAQYTFWGMWNAAQTYIRGQAVADLTAGGAESALALLKGVINLPITVPNAEAIDFPGDNGSVGVMTAKPVGPISAALTTRIEDKNFARAANGNLINANGPYDEQVMSNKGLEFNSMVLVVNAPAQSAETGSVGAAGWDVTELLMVEAHDVHGLNIASRTPREFLKQLIISERDVRFDGSGIVVGTYGVSQSFLVSYWSPYPITYVAYVGDGGAAQAVTLPYIPAAEDGDAVQVWYDGVAQVYTTDYTVSGVTLTNVGTDPGAAVTQIIRMQIADGQLG